MKNTIIFGTGIITGIIATPVAIAYVKPFRNAFGNGITSLIMYGVKTSPSYRESVMKGFVNMKYLINEIEKEYGTRG